MAGGGQKWLRAGWGTGYLALSDRAVERLTPVFSGYLGTADDQFAPGAANWAAPSPSTT